MRTALFVFASLLAAPLPLRADVLVVDPAGGPGADFTALDTAIAAAASGDVLLLRSGTYDGSFSVGSKSLSIIADTGAQVTITNSATGDPGVLALSVGSGAPGTAVVRGLTLTTPPRGGTPLVAEGPGAPGAHLFIEECSVPSTAATGLRLGNTSPLILSRCSANGADADPTPGPDGLPLATAGTGLVAGAGPLALFGGFFVGGEGLDAGLYGPLQTPTPGEKGGSGLHSDNTDGTLRVLSGAGFIGGLGGDGAAPGGNCLPPGNGGDAVLAVSGGQVLFAGSFGIGDLPGTGAQGCNQQGMQGALLAALPGAELPVFVNANPASAAITRVAREQETATLTITAFDHEVVLLMGFEPDFQYSKKLSGALVVVPVLAIDPGTIPPTGMLTVDFVVPELGPGVESVIGFLQVLSRDSQGRLTLGMPTAILLLDDQF